MMTSRPGVPLGEARDQLAALLAAYRADDDAAYWPLLEAAGEQLPVLFTLLLARSDAGTATATGSGVPEASAARLEEDASIAVSLVRACHSGDEAAVGDLLGQAEDLRGVAVFLAGAYDRLGDDTHGQEWPGVLAEWDPRPPRDTRDGDGDASG